MQETMKEVWPFVKRYVPLSCMAQSKEYGSPGWCLGKDGSIRILDPGSFPVGTRVNVQGRTKKNFQ